MEDFFGRRVERLFRLKEQNAEKLALVVFPKFLLEIVRKYFRIETHGLENIPRRGKALIAPNHSGCAGLDAVMLGHVLHEQTGRIPRTLTLWNFFRWFPMFSGVAEKMGLKPATTENGTVLLRKNHLVICFPEGEEGSFKPSSERYRLQTFHTGFIRMALLSGAPIVPCVIIGAEEANINLGTLRLTQYVKPILMPIPFNMVPLPAKWDIRFLPPIDLSAHKDQAGDRKNLERLANEVRAQIQERITADLRQREYVYFDRKPRRRRERKPELG